MGGTSLFFPNATNHKTHSAGSRSVRQNSALDSILDPSRCAPLSVGVAVTSGCGGQPWGAPAPLWRSACLLTQPQGGKWKVAMETCLTCRCLCRPAREMEFIKLLPAGFALLVEDKMLEAHAFLPSGRHKVNPTP